MITRERMRTVGGLVRFYGTTPTRYREAYRALARRGSGPLERREPWWPIIAMDHVRACLPPAAEVFEFGGGGSTLWLSDLGARVVAVEHDAAWARDLAVALHPRAAVRTVASAPAGSVTSAVEGGFFDDYVAAIDDVADGSLDLAVVDGRARVDCALRAMDKIRPGGMLLLDDADRPRYSAITQATSGWARTDYRGAKAGGAIAVTTTWIKPA